MTNLPHPRDPDRLRLPRPPGHHRDRLLGLPGQPAGARRDRSSGSRTRCSWRPSASCSPSCWARSSGVARLSTNVLVRSAAGLYVETLRNLPPLLVIVFVNSAVFLELPVIGDPIDVGGLLVLSNRELAAASPVAGDHAGAVRARRRGGAGGRGRRVAASHQGERGDRRAAPPRASGRASRSSWASSAATSSSTRPITLSHPEAVGRGITRRRGDEHRLRRRRDRPRPVHLEPRGRDRARVGPGGRPRADRGGRGARVVVARSGSASSCCPRRSASRSRR